MASVESGSENRERLHRWGGYALGMVIETAAVIGISLAAVLVMLIVKAIMT